MTKFVPITVSRCIQCNGSGLLAQGLRRQHACPLCDGVEGWPEVVPSVADMNRTGELGVAGTNKVVFREIRASFTDTTIRVYQAYNVDIAASASGANSFRAPMEKGIWSSTRMTWIKPSAVWMAYRCGWTVMKDKNQAAVLALDLSLPRFLDLLRMAVLSHGDGETGSRREFPVVVQWDPERFMCKNPAWKKDKDVYTFDAQTIRSIQIGLRDKGSQMLLDPAFVLKITDVTEDFRRAHAELSGKPCRLDAAVDALWNHGHEERLIVPHDIRSVLCMDARPEE